LHDRTFDLRTGEGIGPDCQNLKTYPIVLTENSQMLLTL
jgi:nitrite reductase/ring-hydroxylating ferredoxin subunit